jgi:hypothetical protein
MKPLLVLIGLVAAAGAGAAGGALFSSPAPSRTVEPIQPSTQVAEAKGISKEAQQRLDSMSMEIAELQTQIAALRQESSRAPAVAPAPEAVSPESPEAFASLHRAAILKVIEDQKAEEERKREEERKQREIQNAKQHADRVATKVPLSDGQKELLAQFYQDDRQKMDEMRTQMRDNVDPGATPARDAFRELREWHTSELTRLFGTELAGQIDEADMGNRRVRAVDGQGGGNGQGGGGNAARPRRGNGGGNNGGAGAAGQSEAGGG